MIRAVRAKLNDNRFLPYLLGGGVSFTVEYMLFLAAFYIFDVGAFNANVLSFCGGLGVSFMINRFIVFGRGMNPSFLNRGFQIASYSALALVNLFVTSVLIEVIIEYGLPGFAAKGIVICLTAAWNFAIFKRIIFREKS